MDRFRDFCGQGRGCGPATSALPGSSEKITALARRVRLRQRLWHPDDAKMPATEQLPDRMLFTNTELRAAEYFGRDGADEMYKKYLKRLRSELK